MKKGKAEFFVLKVVLIQGRLIEQQDLVDGIGILPSAEDWGDLSNGIGNIFEGEKRLQHEIIRSRIFIRFLNFGRDKSTRLLDT